MTVSLRTLSTPSLLLDRDKVDRNILRLTSRLARANVVLRPHVKTAKCHEVVSRMTRAGTRGITVSTLAEAEYFFDRGHHDIIYAVGITPTKLERAAVLRRRGADLKLLADGVAQVKAVADRAAALDVEFPVLIEINSDGLRAGVRPDEPALIEIGKTLDLSTGTSLGGLLTHAGGSYAAKSPSDIVRMAERERRSVVESAARLRAAGLSVPIASVGSTPTVLFSESFEGLTEVRAGVYVFQDLVMAGLGVCPVEDIALSVLCSVIGHQRERNLLVTDAGWTSLSRDRGTADQTLDQGYGLVADEYGVPFPDLIVHSTSQEHGIVGDRSGRPLTFDRFPVGTLLRILPNHACATASCHDAYNVIASSAEVVNGWERCRGW